MNEGTQSHSITPRGRKVSDLDTIPLDMFLCPLEEDAWIRERHSIWGVSGGRGGRGGRERGEGGGRREKPSHFLRNRSMHIYIFHLSLQLPLSLFLPPLNSSSATSFPPLSLCSLPPSLPPSLPSHSAPSLPPFPPPMLLPPSLTIRL